MRDVDEVKIFGARLLLLLVPPLLLACCAKVRVAVAGTYSRECERSQWDRDVGQRKSEREMR